MLLPVVALRSPRAAAEAARLVVIHSRVRRAPGALRYQRDGRLQFWQTPEQTDSRGAGNCVDLSIRWAAWLGRSRPIWLCFARTGSRTMHVYLRADDGTLIDPSIAGGMPALKGGYSVQEVKVRITPGDFVDQVEEAEGGHGGCSCPPGHECSCPAPQRAEGAEIFDDFFDDVEGPSDAAEEDDDDGAAGDDDTPRDEDEAQAFDEDESREEDDEEGFDELSDDEETSAEGFEDDDEPFDELAELGEEEDFDELAEAANGEYDNAA